MLNYGNVRKGGIPLNYYFAFQNTTYNIEAAGGYVWAPTSQQGRYIHSHERVGNLEIGDFIIHCAQSRIRAISKVQAAPAISTNEYAGHGVWDREGFYTAVEYFILDHPVEVRDKIENILNLQPAKYAPFNRAGRGNEGYLFECGRALFDYFSEIAIVLQNEPLVQRRLREFCTDENRINLEDDGQEIEEINRLGVIEEVREYTPVPVPVPQIIQTPVGISYARDRRVALNALAHANHHCELVSDHPSFTRRSSTVLYVEPHHLIPMSAQADFGHSLDVEANIVALCSNCHNEIHYGENYLELIKCLFESRKESLEAAGVLTTLDNLMEYY